jgi:hypothetical protein
MKSNRLGLYSKTSSRHTTSTSKNWKEIIKEKKKKKKKKKKRKKKKINFTDKEFEAQPDHWVK